MKNLPTFNDFLNEEVEAIYNELESTDTEVNEARKRSADEVAKDAENKIKDQIARYSELMKTNPEKADIYKAQLDLAHARRNVLSMKDKLRKVKEKFDR